MEIELKALLDDASEMRRVQAVLGTPVLELDQENLYFDDRDGDWRARGYAVRLRTENGHVRLAVKGAGERRGDYVARGEWERDLEPEEAASLRDDLGRLGEAAIRLLLDDHQITAAVAAELRRHPLEPVGSLHTLRTVYEPPDAQGTRRKFELDETTYPDGSVRWEVEVELSAGDDAAAASESLRACFARAGVPWRVSAVSKRERLQRILDAR